MLARPATSDDIIGGRRGFKGAGVQLRPVRRPTDGCQTPNKGSELGAAVPQFRPLFEARHNNIHRRLQEEATQSIRSESCSYELVRHVRDQTSEWKPTLRAKRRNGADNPPYGSTDHRSTRKRDTRPSATALDTATNVRGMEIRALRFRSSGTINAAPDWNRRILQGHGSI